jgi:hypothetical protein
VAGFEVTGDMQEIPPNNPPSANRPSQVALAGRSIDVSHLFHWLILKEDSFFNCASAAYICVEERPDAEFCDLQSNPA